MQSCPGGQVLGTVLHQLPTALEEIATAVGVHQMNQSYGALTRYVPIARTQHHDQAGPRST